MSNSEAHSFHAGYVNRTSRRQLKGQQRDRGGGALLEICASLDVASSLRPSGHEGQPFTDIYHHYF